MGDREREAGEGERATLKKMIDGARAEVEAARARGDRRARAQAEAELTGFEALLRKSNDLAEALAARAAGDEDVLVPEEGDGFEPRYCGPPPRSVVRWHRGLIAAGIFLAAVLGLVAAGLLLRGTAAGGAAPLLHVAAAVVLFLGVVGGQGARCPRCQGWWARKVVRKDFSHYSNRTERRIYWARFLCQRCGLRWYGYD
jgi:hypothetical protein